jgi:hypothetical protein
VVDEEKVQTCAAQVVIIHILGSERKIMAVENNKKLKSIRYPTISAFYQCCGSGSKSGSTCFWASRIRIHFSEVWIRIRILLWIRILLSLCKNSKKNLDSYYFATLFDFLCLKNDVNVASKSNKQEKLC